MTDTGLASVPLKPRSLAQWLAYIESLHHRSIDMTLERVSAVYVRMGLRLQPATAVISVSGTNGKGSSVAMLDSIYRAAGYRCGRYTSPHLVRYNERIVIDGVALPDEALCAAFARVDNVRGDIPLTYFEFGTLVALQLFAEAAVEVAVLEVGLGGRLDAVNIVDADAALITSIGIDHVAWLGRERETIALEKAGIMRTARPAVSADVRPPAALAQYAAAVGAELLQAGRDFSCTDQGRSWSLHLGAAPELQDAAPELQGLPKPALAGSPQLHNAAGVVALVRALQSRVAVDEAALRRGLREAWLPGRLQCLAGSPQVVLDVAHNPDAVAVLADFMRERRHECSGRVHAVFATLADKPLEQVVELMAAVVDVWYVADIDISGERGRGADETRAATAALVGEFAVHGFSGTVAAFEAARAAAADEDCIVVFGSFITVGDIMQHVAAPLDRNTSLPPFGFGKSISQEEDIETGNIG